MQDGLDEENRLEAGRHTRAIMQWLSFKVMIVFWPWAKKKVKPRKTWEGLDQLGEHVTPTRCDEFMQTVDLI